MTAAQGSPASILFEAFEEDHRHLTEGLYKVLNMLRAGDLAAARQLADELDLVAGPHIAFEEEIFYPSLRQRLGSGFVDNLYDEHDAGKRALLLLRGFDAETAGAKEQAQLVEKTVQWLETALEHALSCGTLLSQLEALEDRELTEMHQTLEGLRSSGRRWTDRPATMPATLEVVDAAPA